MVERIRKLWQESRAYLLFFAGYTVVFALFVQTLAYTLPFVLGILLALITVPICRFLEKKTHCSRTHAALWTAVCAYLLFLTAGAVLLVWLLRELLVFVSDSGYFRYEELSPGVRSAIGRVLAYLPELASRLSEILPGSMASLWPAVDSILKLLLSVPAFFLLLALIPVTAYLVLRFRSRLTAFAAYIVGKERVTQLRRAAHRLSRTSGGFAFSYFLIYTLTFSESFIIFHLLRMKYPLITALVVTVSDIFPVLGPGTVLLPLCVYQLLCGHLLQAAGLFVGWIVLTVIRQIIEPRLVAKVTRTPAIAMPASVYCSLVSGNFWLIPYTGLFFFLLQWLRAAGLLGKKETRPAR